MAKLKLNDLLHEIRGSIGNLTIKGGPHGPIIIPKPATPRRWSAKQKAHREKMRVARWFYREQMSDPARAARHRARAKELGIPVSSYVMGGYLKHGPAFEDPQTPGNTPGGLADGRDGADCE